MSDERPDRKRSGFKDKTRLAAARERLLDAVDPHGRTEEVPLASADGRALAEAVVAARNVPHYPRAAMDGYAVRARDTFGASDRSPEVLRSAGGPEDADEVPPEGAVRVHTGSELPAGADAVVMIEQTDEREALGASDGASGDAASEVEVFDAVAEGENVAPVGEDVESGQRLYDPGHRLRPSDLGLLKSVGVDTVAVRERPTVGVIPTGEELVQADPDPGEVVETNGLTVSHYVERWGGDATYRDVVTDDPDALRAAIQRDLTRDVVVTTGGSSVGERDLLPEVVSELGEILFHGVALKPGHPVAVGVVEDTPVIMLPGYPVACIINAVQFLRPAMKKVGGLPLDDFPTTEARLARKIRSEPGIRTFARVQLGEDEDGESEARRASENASGDEPRATTATPTRASGSGVLSSVALADGWVEVPEGREGIPEGEMVDVQDWEWLA
ncbi:MULTISPECIES: gephyrin-like molybdotransferase Glp [Halorussus]|uniref:molybdopterin molybdotransferase MoeA n=1 Tax=Halorussus TaxID=1070314 RepID=UPI000E20CEA4|nr:MULTISPECIES: gephyrin-like molybdotransferase Glp [Halorussus]NHN59646.1 molybdopterin molybdotransferase MoeA [Halorussus sp. JP-T4]